jgi:hypothetical protein
MLFSLLDFPQGAMTQLASGMTGFNQRAGSAAAKAMGLRGVGWGISALVVALGVWLVVQLLGGFVAPLPAPQQSLRQSPLAVAAQFAERPLLGRKSESAAVAAPVVQNAQLLGVLSSRVASEARAIIRQEGQAAPLVLAIGDELASGVKLLAIGAQQVTLSAMGRESTLALPDPGPPAVLTNKH